MSVSITSPSQTSPAGLFALFPYSGEGVRTPFSPTISLLIPGNFPQEPLNKISAAWSAARTTSPVSPLVTPRMALHSLGGASGAAALHITGDPSPIAVVKTRQMEPGSPAWEQMHPNQSHWRPGCPPGSGPLIEFIALRYIQAVLERVKQQFGADAASICDHVCVPRVAYAQMGHPFFSQLGQEVDPKEARSVRGTGIVAEFLSGFASIRNWKELSEIPAEAMQFMAVMHIVLGSTDVHPSNIMVKDDKIALIDHAYSLSSEGLDCLKVCWLQDERLSAPPQPIIQQMVEQMDETLLSDLYAASCDELTRNLCQLPKEQQRDEERQVQEDRIIPHQLALCFLKKALQAGWSLVDVARALQAPPCPIKSYSRPGLIHSLYQQTIAAHQSMDEICTEAINNAKKRTDS